MSELDRITFNNEIANNPVGVPSDQFTFQTIADLEIPADLEAFDSAVDPEYEAMLNMASDQINKYIAAPTSNYNSPIPGASVGRYSPESQQSAPNINTMEGKIRLFDDIGTRKPVQEPYKNTFGDQSIKIEDPVISGIAATQFDRYYSHPAFSRLGFHPYRNNEEFYNNNSSGWEDAGRMFGQLGKLMGTGYVSSYRSWFEDDVMDLESAIEYEDAVRIGSSSRGGFGGGLNNFVLNSGYTLGIIGSIAVEELLMWGGTVALGATGVGAPAAAAAGTAAAARTAYNVGKLGKAFSRIGQSFKIGKAFTATRNFVNGMKNIDRVRDVFQGVKSGDNILGRMLLPETMSAFKQLNSAKKAGENITNMAKASKTIGGFYRDLRSMNFALSEGRMEGGSVYKEQWQKEYLIALDQNKKEGLGDLTQAQLENVNEKARAAAFTTTAFNAPVIYLSNQLLLGNAFGGFKRSLNQTVREGIEGAAGKVIRGKAAVKTVKDTVKKQVGKEAGKKGKKEIQKDLYEGVEDGFLNWRSTLKKVKSAGLRGGATMAGAAALRYTAANISEGLQEVYQEAVSAGIKDYYTSMAFDPLAGGYDLFAGSMKYGLGEQASGQGLETFLSGFFMGGLVGMPQKAIFQGMPALYQMTFNKEEYAKAKQAKKDAIDRIVKAMNETGNDLANDPTSLFGIDKLNFIAQKQAAEGMEDAQMNDDIMGFVDLKDHAKFMNMFTIFETGKVDFFREQLEDYLSLTDQELAEAFPDRKADAKSGKLRSSIQGQIDKLDSMEEWFANNKDKIQITADPSQYTPGSRDHTEESLKYLAQRHAKFLYLFTRDGFQRAAERTDAIYEQLASDPIIKEIAANDLTVLLNKDTLQEEISALKGEIEILGDPGSKRAKKQKEKKLAHLEEIASILYAEENLKKDGTFDKRKIGKLMPAVSKYLDTLAKTRNGFVNNEMLLDTVKRIIDHNHLSVRQAKYDKALRVLTDPEYLDDLIVRSKLFFQFAYNNKMEIFKEAIEKFVNKEEINQLLNQLANLGVYPDMQDALDFMATGDPKYLENFYNRDGQINEVDDADLYAKVQEKINVYKETASDALKKAAEERAKKAEAESKSQTSREKSVSEILDEAGVEGPESKIYGKTKDESPVLDAALQKAYKKKRAISLALGDKKSLSWEQFVKNDDLAKDIIRAYNGLKKLWYQTLTGIEESKKEERFNKDIGFIQWLKLQKTNDLVFKVLEESSSGPAGLSLNAFIDLAEDAAVTPEDTKKENVDEGSTIDIQSIMIIDPETQQPTTFFRLVDKSGNIIPEDIYVAAGLDPLTAEGFSTKAKAEQARKKLANYVPVYNSFEFDGFELSYGDRIQDKKTKKWYVVISNPVTVEKYNNLLVIKEDDLARVKNPKDAIKKADKLKEGEFAKKFIEEERNAGVASLPDNATKLRVDEATAVIAHQNNRGTSFPEVEESARRRMDTIIKNLTPEELNKLQVVVTKNPDAGTDLGYAKFEDKNPNPFIKTTRSPYNIALVLPAALMDKMAPKLKERNLELPEDNVLGYIPNGDVVLFDKDGQVINPLTITPEQVADRFVTYTSNQQAASDIQQNFAIQFTIMNAINEKIGDLDRLETTLKDIGGVNFFTTPGQMAFDDTDKSILDLNVRSVDGTMVVLENTKGKDGKVATRFITDAERGAGPKIKKKIISEMNDQNPKLYEAAQSSSRYVMIVKSPSGIYSYFPIKSKEVATEDLATIADTLISKSTETVKTNLSGKDNKTVKDLKINSQFNIELNNNELEDVPGFYIASKPGYDFDVNVGANGSVYITVYDRDLGQSRNIVMSAKDVATYAEFENKEKFIDALIDNYNNFISNVDVEKQNPKMQEFYTKLKAKGKLNTNAFKVSFDKNVTTEEIENSVTTMVSPNIRGASKLITNINGVDSQNIKSTPIISRTTEGVFTPTERFTDAEGNPIPSGPTTTTSTESLDDPKAEIASLDELSQEEYDELKAGDFATLSKDQKEYLAKKLAESGPKSLTDRELSVLNNNKASGMINILSQKYKNSSQPKSNAASPNTADAQKDNASLIQQLNDVKSKIEARQEEIRKANIGKVKRSEIIKLWNSDSQIKKLEKQKSEIESKLSANKISDTLNLDDVRHIDEFIAWASANLPDFITIDDIRTLSDNMKSGGERVGAFVMQLEKIAGKERIGGKLFVGATSKYAYHEAFHSVFRLLLTKEQQEEYYKIARKEVLSKLRAEGKNLKTELERLRNGDIDKYRNFSQEALEKEYLEEYMADQFEIFKQNPKGTKTSSWIKSLFNKILEWIRNVLGNFNGNQLQALYKDISAGKFKTAEVASNPFTDAASQGISVNASKLLRYKAETLENGTKLYRTLPNKMGRGIVSSIAARVVNMEMKNEDPDFNIIDAVEESVDMYEQLYDVDNAQYENASTQQLLNLMAITESFQDFRKDIVESVIEELALYDVKLELVDDLDQENEMDYGLRTTEQYDKDASQTGGFRSLSSFLRKYIGTTTLSEKDEFGNEFLSNGERIIVPVDFGSAYSGFLKAAAGQTDPVRILQQLYIFSQNNPQTKAVVEKLFNDLGLVWEGQLQEGIIPGETQDNLLFQAVLKGFENFKVDYLFLHTNTENGQVISYSAANRDDAHTQIERWDTEYKHRRRLYLADPKLKEEASDQLDILLDYLDTKNPIKSITNKKLNEVAKDISKALVETMGIRLHPDYIIYSIAQNITKPTVYQKQLLQSRQDVITIQWDDIAYMKEQFDSDNNIMAQDQDEGVYNRLRKLGLGNALFDETVGASVFKNPNGDLVYAHQLPTFHLKKIASLNDVDGNGKALDDLMDQDPYLAFNYLLNDAGFRQMAKEGLLKVTRISGSKASKGIQVDSDGGVVEKYDRNEEGTVYGDYNPKQFLNALLSSYIAGINPKSGKIQDGVIPEGQKDMVALAPVLLRVIEASNTGDMVKLPVIQAVQQNAKGDPQITSQALDAYVNNIMAEFDRIKKELNPATRTAELIPGYNASKDGQTFNENGRAFSFHNNKLVLTPVKQTVSDLETGKLLDSESTITRLRNGEQKIFIKTDKAAAAMGFFAEGEVTNLEMAIGEQTKDKKGKTKFKQKTDDKATYQRVKLLGNKNITNLTLIDMLTQLGGAVSDTKTETHIKEVKIGNNTYWVESDLMADFITGKKEAYVYQVVEEDINEMSDAELETRLNEAIEQEDYDVAVQIRNLKKYDEINYAEEIARVLKENAALPEDQQVELSLTDVLSKLGKTMQDLRDFISLRVDQEFRQFNRDINNEFYRVDEETGKPILELPTFISSGVQRNSNSTGSQETFDVSNQKLNLTNNRTYNVKQIFINDWINTSAMNDILLGDQAMSLKDAVDAVKRAKMQNAAYYSAASTIASPKHGILNPLQKISMFAVTDPIAPSIHTGEEIEQSDAQNWMTVKAFRYMFFGFGKLTETQAKLLDKVEAGEEITTDEIFGAAGAAKKQEMLNSKKLVYGDGKVFDKFSIIPLSKALTSMKDENGNWVALPGREILHNMRVKMEQFEQDQLDQGIDTVAMIAPLSALKMMKKNVSLIDDLVNSGNPITQKESKFLGPAGSNDYMNRRLDYEAEGDSANRLTTNEVMDLDANFMGLQVLNPSNKLEIVDPTQIKTLLTGEQNDATEVILDGETVTVGKLRAAYNSSVAKRLEQKYLDKRNLVFDIDPEYAMDQLHESIKANAITPDLYAFLQYAQTALMSSQSSGQLLDFFSFDEQGNPNFDLNNPITESKFKQLFLSYFSKSVMSEKIPGTAAALLSDYGFSQYRKVYSVDENGYIDRQEIIRTNDFAQNYSMDDVQMDGNQPLDLSNDDKFDVLKERVSKLKKGEYIIVRDRLRPDMKEYDSKGKYTGIKYTESLMPAHSKEAYEMYDKVPSKKIADVLSKMFGIRIPSQDNHSTVNIKVVDFLPVFHGSTIVSARELVEVSGADFDIDKLYIQMKEYYEKNGEIIEYKNNFEDYVNYVNKAVQKKGSTYAEAAAKSINRDARSLSNAELKEAKSLGFSKNAINALRMLNLPLNEKQFDKYVETTGRAPFAAGYNNQILDYKFALMGNDAVTTKQGDQSAISYEPADMEILKDIWKEISTEVPELAEALAEDNIDANNLFGKWKGFANNKEGAKSIGAAVLPNLYLSLLQEVGIKFNPIKGGELKLGGQVFDGFFNKLNGKDRSKEILEDGSLGRRKQYIISALITAMTDNAKERLAAKLGLSRNGLAIVTNMTAMGVPIKTSILMMNHPTIRDAYKLESRAPAFTFNVKEFIEDKMAAIKNAGMQYDLIQDDELGTVEVNQSNLYDAIKDPIVSFKTEAQLEDKIEKGKESNVEVITREQILRDYSILNEFIKAFDIASFLRPVGDLMNLAKGFGKDSNDVAKIAKAREDLGLDLTDSDLKNLPPNQVPLMDLRPVFNDERWQTKMLDIYDEFVGSLLPKVFLNESVPFKNILNGMFANIRFVDKDQREVINKDLLSYVTIQGYLHWLSGNPSAVLGTPDNALIYPEEGKKDIVDVYEELKTLNGDKYNFFLDGFVRPEKATDEGNKTGISMLSSNTLTPLNDSQKMDVQNGFRELFVDPVTRGLAMRVLNYMIVKDGMQPVYKSLISAVSPEMFGEYLGILPTIQDAFATMSDAKMESTFGMSFKDLKLNFMKEYTLHPKTANLLITKVIFPEQVYSGKSKVTQSKGQFTQNTVENNEDKLFVIFDNESGQGSSFSKSVRNATNVVRIITKKNPANSESDFYSASEQNDAIAFMENQIKLIRDLSENYSAVVLQNEMDPAEIDGLEKYSPDLYNELIDAMSLNFDYKLTGLTKEETKEERKQVNTKAKSLPVFVSDQFDRATLTVDLEKGMAATPRFEEGETFKPRTYATIKGKATIARNNLMAVKSLFKTAKFQEGKEEKNLALFPQVIRLKIDGKNRYFQLVRHAGPEYGNIGEGISSPIAMGTFAQYIEVDVMGSSAQTPVGFIFGKRDTNNKIKDRVAAANKTESEGQSENALDIQKRLKEEVTYEYGTLPSLDRKLEDMYNNWIGKTSKSFEFYLDTIVVKNFIKSELDKLDGDVTFENGEVKTEGSVPTVEELKEGKTESSFSVTPEKKEEVEGEVTSSFSVNPESPESTENADEGIPQNQDLEKLEEFYDSLSLPQKLRLQAIGFSNLAALEKESKKDMYKSMDDFIDQLKQCF